MFLDRGFDEVGLREIAAVADVAVTTVFAHFPAKEALVFERDDEFRRGYVHAVTDREEGEPLIVALRDRVRVMVEHCTSGRAAELWSMIDSSPTLQQYDGAMRLRHAEALAEALATDPEVPSPVAAQVLANFVVDSFALARVADEPEAAIDEIFMMIEAAWSAARGARR